MQHELGKRVGVLIVALSAGGAGAATLPPTTTDARQIMTTVEKQDRGDRQVSRIQVEVKSKANGDTSRVMRSSSIKFAAGTKQLLFFESPADVRNVGLLTIDYDDGKKSDDQWLYLPALHRSSRITTSDRTGSFMGTDFSYSDMTKRDPEQYDYRLLEPSVNVAGEDCWHIEGLPRTDKEKKETGYGRMETWISKSRLMPLQSKLYSADGKQTKYLQFKDYRQVSNIWVAHEVIARTVEGTSAISTTVMKLGDVRFGAPEVTEGEFTERRLEKGL